MEDIFGVAADPRVIEVTEQIDVNRHLFGTVNRGREWPLDYTELLRIPAIRGCSCSKDFPAA